MSEHDTLGRPDIKAEADAAFAIASSGGLVLFGTDIGYGFLTSSLDTLRRLHEVKQRPLTKRTGIACAVEDLFEMDVLDSRAREMISMLVDDFDLPIGVVAPFNPDHPYIRNLSPELLEVTAYKGTMSTVVNHGDFAGRVSVLARENGYVPLFGSSANMSGTGQKFTLDEVQPQLRDIADLVLDHGLCKYSSYRRASTMIDFATMEVNRIGTCYDVIASLLSRFFGVELPPDPGYDALPLGHLKAPLEALDHH